MTHDQFQAWLNRYVEAWKTYDRDEIVSLFSADAEYRYHPSSDSLTGAQEIATNWLENQDDIRAIVRGLRDRSREWQSRCHWLEPLLRDSRRRDARRVLQRLPVPLQRCR